jgi:hypothetical protein
VSSNGSLYTKWLTRKALLEAKDDENEWPGISVSTTGLLFFGTPFRGAEGMSQIEMLAAAHREYEPDQVQPEVLKILEPGNEFLQDLVDRFGKTWPMPNKAQVACFYELKSSNVGAIIGGQARTVCLLAEVQACISNQLLICCSGLSLVRALAASTCRTQQRNTPSHEPTST